VLTTWAWRDARARRYLKVHITRLHSLKLQLSCRIHFTTLCILLAHSLHLISSIHPNHSAQLPPLQMLQRFLRHKPTFALEYIAAIFATTQSRYLPIHPNIRWISSGTSRAQGLSSVRQFGCEASTDRLDPYVYTSGRWLHRDQLQREARLLKFDFSALCEKVISLCPGAHKIRSYDKKEGGFNRVFIFQMDNGARIVARIPFRIAGPEVLTTHSEVATMDYSKLTPFHSV
jgi:hypothetical protein